MGQTNLWSIDHSTDTGRGRYVCSMRSYLDAAGEGVSKLKNDDVYQIIRKLNWRLISLWYFGLCEIYTRPDSMPTMTICLIIIE